MAQRMLIDARHPEETRVAVVKGNRIEEFDFESTEHKQIKGNIYLAKVTRVEPSLQAAFVDYGGNRHGFLAFSEIHPDYYQIPKEDREALLREEAEYAEEEARLRDEDGDLDPVDDHHDDDGVDHDRPDSNYEDSAEGDENGEPSADDVGGEHGHDESEVRESRARRSSLRRRYKIQDVIHRRQVLLVQVVKEERGNKGAALTSYLSLAGRYCVLMPNSTHGGGISRKISNSSDRKRLKSIISDLELPRSMGMIVRTAGLSRTKAEIKRDFDYLARLWDDIRENTLKSSAPARIHNDSNLIKRAIRDIYNREMDDVLIEGDMGFKAARDFMKLLMPSHVKKLTHYSDPVSLFQRYGIEDQLNAMYNPVVQLKSGGYLVINPTEALVSIDINSGRSTREHGIEQTAINTNLEAAQEIARQLRLRDMAGLVVIDFIDMEHGSNVRKVERAMKTALADDRARIQVGRISSFGLLEMSRQRLRTGVLEASTRSCPHCEGTGLVRTASSSALSALRILEDEAARGRGSVLTLRVSSEAAFYLLNNKRAELADIEVRYGVHIDVEPDGENEGARMSVAASGSPPVVQPRVAEALAPIIDDDEDEIEDDIVEDNDEQEEADQSSRDDGTRKRSRRRRGRRGRRDGAEGGEAAPEAEGDSSSTEGQSSETAPDRETSDGADGEPRSKSRRGRRRRGRRGEGQTEGNDQQTPTDDQGYALSEGANNADAPEQAVAEPDVEATAKKPRGRGRTKKVADAESSVEPAVEPVEAVETPAAVAEDGASAKPKRARKPAKPAAVEQEPSAEAPASVERVIAEEVAPAEKPKRTRKTAPKASSTEAPVVVSEDIMPAEEADPQSADGPRRGWWQRTFGE
jgi:ribonuclease E